MRSRSVRLNCKNSAEEIAANRSINYVIANETASLPGAQHTQGKTPVYVDAANGD